MSTGEPQEASQMEPHSAHGFSWSDRNILNSTAVMAALPCEYSKHLGLCTGDGCLYSVNYISKLSHIFTEGLEQQIPQNVGTKRKEKALSLLRREGSFLSGVRVVWAPPPPSGSWKTQAEAPTEVGGGGGGLVH